MSFKWKNVNIEVENTNKNIEQPFLDIIKNSSGEVNHGEIYAIMGPSGGGKTTLLNALAGRIPINSKTQGEITYNNKARNKSQWLKMVGFVNQDDCVYDDLTILETLTYAAKFRLNNQQGGKHTNEEISVIVDKVISDLKLNGVSKNEVKKLSGGERKRLSLGIELITDPPLIFLDEPTSGLDTLTALKICKILKELAVEKKKIILLTIHQPSQEIFYLFDYLLLLSKGNAIYNGRVDQAERYFMEKQIVRRSLITLPEFIVEICSDDFKDENPHLFYCEESIFKDDIVIKEEKIRKKKNDVYINVTPNLRHIFLLLKRKFTIETHRKMNFLKAQGAKMLIYLFLVYFNYQSYKLVNSNATAFLGLNSEAMEALGGSKEAEKLQFAFCTGLIVTSTLFLVIFSQVSSTITSFFDEVPFVKRELAVDSYSVASYFISLLLYQILIETVAPVIACILMHRYVPVTNMYVIAALLLTGLFTVPFGLCIGSISTAKQIVIILSSVFGTLSSIPTSTISELIQRYGTNADGSRNGFSHLTYLTVILSPLYWSAFLINSCYKAGIDSVSSNYITNMLKERVGDIMVKNVSFINGHHLSMWLLFILMIVSPIFCILIGIVLLGLNLMPDIRMRLEKDYKNKSK